MGNSTSFFQSRPKVELNIKEKEAENYDTYSPSDVISITVMWS